MAKPDQKPEEAADRRKPGQKAQDSEAMLRGDIQNDRMRDKKPGFDPAAAPMETDAEAAATPTPPEAVAAERAAGRANADPKDYQGWQGTAMRDFEKPAHQPRRPPGFLIVIACLVVGAAVVAALVR